MKKTLLLLLILGYLGLSGEHLALFENNQVKTLPYPAALFSREDLAALKRGLPYNTPQERSALLEDFTS